MPNNVTMSGLRRSQTAGNVTRNCNCPDCGNVYLTDSDFCRKCGLSRAKMEEKLREMAMTPRSRKKKTDEHKESFHKRRVETDADGMTTVTEFDDDFTVISTHHYNSSETNQSESYEGMTPRSRKSKHHESYFRTVTETDSNGKMTVTEYDSDGRIVTQTVTDEHGTVDSSTVTCDCGSQYSTLVDFCQFCGLAKSELVSLSFPPCCNHSPLSPTS